MAKSISVNERIKELKKELNYKSGKKKHIKLKEINVKKYKKKRKRKEMMKYKDFYVRYLETLSEDEQDAELNNIEFMYTFLTGTEIRERDKRLYKIEKEKKRKFDEYIEKCNPKNYVEYVKYEDKYYAKARKKQKYYKKKGLNISDSLFTTLQLDEDKMIKNLKQISKENKERTDKFLEYIDKMYKGEDVPEIIQSLKDKSDKVTKANKKYVKSLEKNGLKPGTRY